MRVEMRQEIHRIHLRLGATILYVTHDQTEAMTLGDRIVVMEAGRIRQIDDPITLYNHPRNRFSAGFIGTPPMNVLPARAAGFIGTPPMNVLPARAEAGRLRTPAGDLLPPPGWPLPDAPRDVLFGIRPEALTLQDAPAPGALPATVDLVERMGAEAYAHLTPAGCPPVIARIPAEAPLRHGDQRFLLPDYTHACLFDPLSGDRL